MLRKILGTVGGALVAMIVVAAMDALSHALFPLAVAKSSQTADIGAALAAAPFAALAIMAAGWFLAVVIGGYVAVKAAHWPAAGWIVALLILAACLFNGFAIPGVPLWMIAAGVVLPLLGGWIVQRWVRP